MKRIGFLLLAVATLAGAVAFMAPAFGRAVEETAPIFLTKVPPGYRDWKLVSVAHEEGELNDIRAILGNDIAIKAYRGGQLPFPDGAIIVAQHWTKESSPENDKILALLPMVAGAASPTSFIPGPVINMQVMVKDSKKYAATGGWGFGDFKDGKPSGEALHKTCFPCHEPGKDRDFVFTRYAP